MLRGRVKSRLTFHSISAAFDRKTTEMEWLHRSRRIRTLLSGSSEFKSQSNYLTAASMGTLCASIPSLNFGLSCENNTSLKHIFYAVKLVATDLVAFKQPLCIFSQHQEVRSLGTVCLAVSTALVSNRLAFKFELDQLLVIWCFSFRSHGCWPNSKTDPYDS